MEFLGQTTNSFKKTNTKWGPIDLVYENEEKFCEATSKLIDGFHGECRFVIADKYDERHFVYILDYRYTSIYNTIQIYPENVRVIKK